MMRRWCVGVIVAASVCLGAGAAWACPASQGWTYQPGEGIPECLVVTTLNPHTLEDGRFTFENGCVGEVTLDATRCDACTCEVGCDTPGPIEPGEAVEVVVTASDEPRETHPLEFQIGLVVYDAAFENDLSICSPPRDDGCAAAGAQAPARRAPWGGLVVVLGLWGWRRRRG